MRSSPTISNPLSLNATLNPSLLCSIDGVALTKLTPALSDASAYAKDEPSSDEEIRLRATSAMHPFSASVNPSLSILAISMLQCSGGSSTIIPALTLRSLYASMLILLPYPNSFNTSCTDLPTFLASISNTPTISTSSIE
ncbi:hypothetical protein HRbin04_01138 [archaeon HR04]|nr:hypothetical protein HRbin04_01138 [archaeon HR04]